MNNYSFENCEYLRVQMLEDKLMKSEMERIKLESKFQAMMTAFKHEEQARMKNLQDKYTAFLADCEMRKKRNLGLLKSLEKVEHSAQIVFAKTERLKQLRSHYDAYLSRVNPLWRYPNISAVPIDFSQQRIFREYPAGETQQNRSSQTFANSSPPQQRTNHRTTELTLTNGNSITNPDFSSIQSSFKLHPRNRNSSRPTLNSDQTQLLFETLKHILHNEIPSQDYPQVTNLGFNQNQIKVDHLSEISKHDTPMLSELVNFTPVKEAIKFNLSKPDFDRYPSKCSPDEISVGKTFTANQEDKPVNKSFMKPAKKNIELLKSKIRRIAKTSSEGKGNCNVIQPPKREILEQRNSSQHSSPLSSKSPSFRSSNEKFDETTCDSEQLSQHKEISINKNNIESHSPKVVHDINADEAQMMSIPNAKMTPMLERTILVHQKSIEELKGHMHTMDDNSVILDEDVPDEFIDENIQDSRYQTDVIRKVILEEDEPEEPDDGHTLWSEPNNKYFTEEQQNVAIRRQIEEEPEWPINAPYNRDMSRYQDSPEEHYVEEGQSGDVNGNQNDKEPRYDANAAEHSAINPDDDFTSNENQGYDQPVDNPNYYYSEPDGPTYQDQHYTDNVQYQEQYCVQEHPQQPESQYDSNYLQENYYPEYDQQFDNNHYQYDKNIEENFDYNNDNNNNNNNSNNDNQQYVEEYNPEELLSQTESEAPYPQIVEVDSPMISTNLSSEIVANTYSEVEGVLLPKNDPTLIPPIDSKSVGEYNQDTAKKSSGSKNFRNAGKKSDLASDDAKKSPVVQKSTLPNQKLQKKMEAVEESKKSPTTSKNSSPSLKSQSSLKKQETSKGNAKRSVVQLLESDSESYKIEGQVQDADSDFDFSLGK